VLLATIEIVGIGLTCMEMVVESLHIPFAPNIVYVELEVGETITLLLELPKGFQEKVVAPSAINIVDSPSHIIEFDTVTLNEGIDATLIVIVSEFTQPFKSVPTKLYIVVADGFTLKFVPFDKLGNQV
jgi:hypothetical protein